MTWPNSTRSQGWAGLTMPPVRPSCDKGPVTIASLVGTDSGSAVKKKVLAAWVTPGEPGAAPCVPRGQGGEPNIRENG